MAANASIITSFEVFGDSFDNVINKIKDKDIVKELHKLQAQYEFLKQSINKTKQKSDKNAIKELRNLCPIKREVIDISEEEFSCVFA